MGPKIQGSDLGRGS